MIKCKIIIFKFLQQILEKDSSKMPEMFTLDLSVIQTWQYIRFTPGY